MGVLRGLSAWKWESHLWAWIPFLQFWEAASHLPFKRQREGESEDRNPKQAESEKDSRMLCDPSALALVFLPPQGCMGIPRPPEKQHPGLRAWHYPQLDIMQGFTPQSWDTQGLWNENAQRAENYSKDPIQGVSSYFIFSTKSWKQLHKDNGTEWDGAHSMWFCSRLVKWQLRRAGHSPRRTTSPRKESRLNTGMTLTWTRQALCYSLRSRGICIPPHGSWWATPGFVRETRQILIWWAVSETDTPAQVEMEVKMQLRCLLRRKSWASLWLSGKEPTCQGRRHWFDPLSRRIPHVVEQPSPWARIIEPELWSLGAQTAEPICHNYRSACAPVPVLRNEKALWWAARTLETSSSSKTQHSQK